MRARFILIFILVSALSSCATMDDALLVRIDPDVEFEIESNQEDEFEEVYTDLIHSDVPLFGTGGENIWPRGFVNEDTFGCTSRVAFGDWRLEHRNGDDPDWYRFKNYGVMHCWANVGEAYEQSDLESANSRPAFFILLGTVGAGSDLRELWAIQLGARPGSDYMLLSRSPREGLIEEFEVLQTRCSLFDVREGPSLSILLARYCALNSQAEMLGFATEMSRLPPLGKLARLPDTDQRDE